MVKLTILDHVESLIFDLLTAVWSYPFMESSRRQIRAEHIGPTIITDLSLIFSVSVNKFIDHLRPSNPNIVHHE